MQYKYLKATTKYFLGLQVMDEYEEQSEVAESLKIRVSCTFHLKEVVFAEHHVLNYNNLSLFANVEL